MLIFTIDNCAEFTITCSREHTYHINVHLSVTIRQKIFRMISLCTRHVLDTKKFHKMKKIERTKKANERASERASGQKQQQQQQTLNYCAQYNNYELLGFFFYFLFFAFSHSHGWCMHFSIFLSFLHLLSGSFNYERYMRTQPIKRRKNNNEHIAKIRDSRAACELNTRRRNQRRMWKRERGVVVKWMKSEFWVEPKTLAIRAHLCACIYNSYKFSLCILSIYFCCCYCCAFSWSLACCLTIYFSFSVFPCEK